MASDPEESKDSDRKSQALQLTPESFTNVLNRNKEQSSPIEFNLNMPGP